MRRARNHPAVRIARRGAPRSHQRMTLTVPVGSEWVHNEKVNVRRCAPGRSYNMSAAARPSRTSTRAGTPICQVLRIHEDVHLPPAALLSGCLLSVNHHRVHRCLHRRYPQPIRPPIAHRPRLLCVQPSPIDVVHARGLHAHVRQGDAIRRAPDDVLRRSE